MQIAKSKGVEDVSHMEDKLQEMGRELGSIRDKEAMLKSQLEDENIWLRRQLQKRGRELVIMASFSVDTI